VNNPMRGEIENRGAIRGRGGWRRGWVGGLLLLLGLLLAACSSAAAASTAVPTSTALPTSTPLPAPTATAVPEVALIPSVTVADQELVDGTVTVAAVVSNGPGWIVIHADQDGAPGPVLGHAAVADGENTDVVVALAEQGRTATMYAMLHTDAGQVGTYEFPGDDGPVRVDGQVVTPAFHVTAATSEMPTPSVTVADQALVDGAVTVAAVVSNGPGWIVIHADQDGAPGPVLGHAALADGENEDVAVTLDLAGLTGTLYAMLHTDAGQVGTYEFPGDDAPVQEAGAIVMAPFALDAAAGDVGVSMANFSFSPARLVVRAGTTVTWTNRDEGIRHTTTSDAGLWDSGLLSGGDTFSTTFDEPGVYPFYCRPHGGPGGEGMSGTIIVIP
jgi:plastocyanin